MIKIGDKFNDYKAGMFYRAIKVGKTNEGRSVILAESKTARSAPITGYDVIILNAGNTIPNSEKWGESAWSWISLEQAEKCFNEVCIA